MEEKRKTVGEDLTEKYTSFKKFLLSEINAPPQVMEQFPDHPGAFAITYIEFAAPHIALFQSQQLPDALCLKIPALKECISQTSIPAADKFFRYMEYFYILLCKPATLPQ
jgi:hypothetical protein